MSREGHTPEIRAEMKEVAAKRRRFGHQRIGVILKRWGVIMNHKKLFRRSPEENLGVRQRRGRKSSYGSRTPMLQIPATGIRICVRR